MLALHGIDHVQDQRLGTNQRLTKCSIEPAATPLFPILAMLMEPSFILEDTSCGSAEALLDLVKDLRNELQDW